MSENTCACEGFAGSESDSRMLGRRMSRSAALNSEIEYKRPATLEEESMFVIMRQADETTQLLTVMNCCLFFCVCVYPGI